jgi:hypothetical protein
VTCDILHQTSQTLDISLPRQWSGGKNKTKKKSRPCGKEQKISCFVFIPLSAPFYQFCCVVLLIKSLSTRGRRGGGKGAEGDCAYSFSCSFTPTSVRRRRQSRIPPQVPPRRAPPTLQLLERGGCSEHERLMTGPPGRPTLQPRQPVAAAGSRILRRLRGHPNRQPQPPAVRQTRRPWVVAQRPTLQPRRPVVHQKRPRRAVDPVVAAAAAAAAVVFVPAAVPLALLRIHSSWPWRPCRR